MTERQATQADKFKDATDEADCDDDEARWTERLKKVAKHGSESEPEVKE